MKLKEDCERPRERVERRKVAFMEGRIVDWIGTKVKDKRLWVVLEAEY